MAGGSFRVSIARQRKRLLQGVILLCVLGTPLALYAAARAGNHPLLWGLVAIVAGAMALAMWVG